MDIQTLLSTENMSLAAQIDAVGQAIMAGSGRLTEVDRNGVIALAKKGIAQEGGIGGSDPAARAAARMLGAEQRAAKWLAGVLAANDLAANNPFEDEHLRGAYDRERAWMAYSRPVSRGERPELTGTGGGKEKRDFRRDLTDEIVDLIEQGAAPWQKPWSGDAAGRFLQMPHNATTGRAYRGGNAIYLMVRAQAMGSADPRWCTLKQANDKGWRVRKGSRGTSVEYWQFERRDKVVDPETGQEKAVVVRLEKPKVFYAKVFHASQLDGIPEYVPEARSNSWDPVLEAERIIAGSGARILHDQVDSAYYLTGADRIHLPPREAFPSPLDYYEVALHELGHWTGHSSRLNRDLTGTFGSASYAREELRAQMASLFLSAELGVPFNPERHAAYQGSWVKALREDKNEIFRAARDAEGIADYLVGLALDHRLMNAAEQAVSETSDALRGTGAARQLSDEEIAVTLVEEGEDPTAEMVEARRRELLGPSPADASPTTALDPVTVRTGAELPFILILKGESALMTNDGAGTFDERAVGVFADGADISVFWAIGREGDERSFTRLEAKSYEQALHEAVSRGALSSELLASSYPAKGSMPQDLVEQLYEIRAVEVKMLGEREVINASDLASLDKGARAALASTHLSICDDGARSALQRDQHHWVRSATDLAQREDRQAELSL
ncbi:zincin-like metallopeptidase domain-containing protein [Pandoraea communis]|uniref:zincin-like metallopeptidase domain-containing protein n=1 Tax=Pandoraea communis TaxID=2508297 RepID=UPI0025A532A2|nr:zincin-like metallopeptidase domain-containing protein [Pandoraea communis]MDM8356624.1 zincin-like metallopeptidase domain-containing protein [Pandoraea communis]